MKKLFILCIGLALLLCACATPGPSTNLSDFVTAFDLSDLSRYLTEEQLYALDGALSENLSMAHGIDNYALYYGDPPEGSVKLPFDNAGGLSLANLDIEKLAERIAGQIAAELEGKGEPVIAASSAGSTATTTTTKPSTTTTGSTTTATTNATTTTIKAASTSFSLTDAEIQKIYYDMNNAGMRPQVFGLYSDPVPMLFDFNTDGDPNTNGKMYISREKFDGNKMVLHVYGSKGNSNDFEYITTITQKVDDYYKGELPQLSAKIYITVGKEDSNGYQTCYEFLYVVSENQRFTFGGGRPSVFRKSDFSKTNSRPDRTVVDLSAWFR